MKKVVLIAFCGIALFSACSGGKGGDSDRINVEADSLSAVLVQERSDRDSLLAFMTEVQSSLMSLKDAENIVSSGNLTGEQSKQVQLRDNINDISKSLQERRERLAQLEAKLSKSKMYSSTLQKTIDELKKQIDSQAEMITTLRGQLDAANAKIGELNTTVDNLNTTVTEVTSQKAEAEAAAKTANDNLNTCFYAIGSKKELKDHGIVEGGTLFKKTKLMAGDFQQGYFTKGDKRKITNIPLFAKKAKVLTNMPKSSYELVEKDGSITLVIHDSKAFWSLSNYLVVQIN